CLLLVDAAEGPMPQTRFVLRKAFEVGLRPIVVINKLDRPNAEPERTLERVHDLFLELAQTADQLDAPVIYTVAKEGRAGLDPRRLEPTLEPLFAAILEHVPAPIAEERAEAADIVLITGLDEVAIGDTLVDPDHPDRLPGIEIGEPTVRMTFGVNTSPLAGRESRFSTSRQLRARLYRELDVNLGLRVDETDTAERFRVSGRGELHLAVLIENLRREGYELEVSRPEAIVKQVDGQKVEPVERLTLEVREEHLGAVTEALGLRRGEMIE